MQSKQPILERKVVARSNTGGVATWLGRNQRLVKLLLFESAHDGVLLVDAATRKTVDANPFMTEVLGYTREELQGNELWA
jgi:PAS domain-containing protein